MTPKLYPIPISPHDARDILLERVADLDKQIRTCQRAERVYQWVYSGELHEDGHVVARVGYRGDNGFRTSSVTLVVVEDARFEEAYRSTLIADRRRLIATHEYERRKEEERNAQIAALDRELFGPDA